MGETQILTRFDVANHVLKGKNKGIIKETKLTDSWTKLGKIEAYSPLPPHSVKSFAENNLFADAVHTAFIGHYPLRLTPDMVWFTITQGLCNHVNQNSEQLRHNFVTFEGKKTITISCPDFVKGSSTNDWTRVFPMFSDKIAEHIGLEKRDLIECRFSTTTQVERICSQIALMDTVKSYFDYVMMCGCGIPYIELTGTVDDWVSIRERADSLRQFQLDWWIDELNVVLDQFVAAANGNSDKQFWASVCSVSSGGSIPSYEPISGWIQVFFPYISARGSALRKNDYLGEWKKGVGQEPKRARGFDKGRPHGVGIDIENIPSGICTAPFTYVDLLTGLSHDMSFNGGLVTIVQDENGVMEPKFGWAVLEKNNNNDQTNIPNRRGNRRF